MARRDRRVMSAALFAQLIDHASTLGDQVLNADQSRYLKRLNDDDAELMAKAKTASIVVTRQIRLVRLEWQSQVYFCLLGLPEAEFLPEGLELADITPALFSLGVLESGVRPPPTVSSAAIKDALNSAYIGSPDGYEGHDLAEIRPMFPEMFVYRSVSPADYHKKGERVLGSFLAKAYLDGPIALDPETIVSFSETFERGSPKIPFEILIQGILSISWENLYVEIYRCIEQLYSASRVSILRSHWASSMPLRDLAKLLEKHLSWRPKEEEAFREIVLLCGPDIVSAICAGLPESSSDTHEDRCSFVASSLYRLRNQIVHYRPIHERVQKTETEWNIVIRGMLAIMNTLYENRAADFFGEE